MTDLHQARALHLRLLKCHNKDPHAPQINKAKVKGSVIESTVTWRATNHQSCWNVSVEVHAHSAMESIPYARTLAIQIPRMHKAETVDANRANTTAVFTSAPRRWWLSKQKVPSQEHDIGEAKQSKWSTIHERTHLVEFVECLGRHKAGVVVSVLISFKQWWVHSPLVSHLHPDMGGIITWVHQMFGGWFRGEVDHTGIKVEPLSTANHTSVPKTNLVHQWDLNYGPSVLFPIAPSRIYTFDCVCGYALRLCSILLCSQMLTAIVPNQYSGTRIAKCSWFDSGMRPPRRML